MVTGEVHFTGSLTPDLICVYIASSIMCAILKAICAGVGIGSRTETMCQVVV